jgi:lipopolysaccharide export system permease protein
VKATQLVVHDVPLSMVGRYLLIGIPESFAFKIPRAAHVSSLLVFGRLSSDGEIGAMKACGVNLWHIMALPMAVGALLSLFGVYINNEVTPASHEMRREMQADMKVGTGIRLLEPGRTIHDFGGLGADFWFEANEEVDGTNWLANVSIYNKTKGGTPRTIHAKRASVIERGEDIVLDLYDVRIDPFDDHFPGAATAYRFSHVFEGVLKKNAYTRKIEDYRLRELYDRVGEGRKKAWEARQALREAEASGDTEQIEVCRARTKKVRGDLRQMRFEFHRRHAMASAAFCFLMLGMPLGIRAHRRESTIGVAISLVVALLFYLLVVTGEQFVKNVDSGPVHLIVWVPVVLCIVLSAWLTIRNG